MRNISIFLGIIAISLLLLDCHNNRGTSNQGNIENESVIYFHFKFMKFDTVEVIKCFGQKLANNLLALSSSGLSDVYIVEIQNFGLDSILIPCKYISDVPIYHSGQTKYFSSLNDTLLLNFDLPFNSPPTNYQRILRNEKKYFLTSIILNENIAKINYSFYSYINNEKKSNQIIAILTKRNNEIIDMTKY